MNPRLRRIVAPPVVIAICFGLLVALLLILRAVLSLPLFEGPELFLWSAVTSAVLAVSIVAEFVSARFRFKYFLLGFLGFAVFLGCAVIANWARTGVFAQPDAQSWWAFALISIAGGAVSHLCIRKRSVSPPNKSLERTREG